MLNKTINQIEVFSILTVFSNPGVHFQGYLTLNGIQQWVSIVGQATTNPVLLIIHGGPASTYSVFTRATQLFSQKFTVVHWDQRGAGKTYRKQPVVPKSLQSLVNDGIELSKKIKQLLPKAPIILLGSSIGSITANLMVQQAESLYTAYIGTEQMTRSSHQYAFNQLMFETSHRFLKQNWLQKYPFNANTWSAKQIETFNIFSALQKTNVDNMVTNLFIPNLLQCPSYGPQDYIAFAKGMIASYNSLHTELDTFDYNRLLTETNLPFYIFQGEHDPITPTQATKIYFNHIKAPRKKMIIVPGTGHLCMFARPRYFIDKASELRRLVLEK